MYINANSTNYNCLAASCFFVELTLHYMFSLREETLIIVSSMKKGNGLIRFI